VLVGRFDGLLQDGFRSLGLVPTGIDGPNIWLICARISMAHVACLAAVFGSPAIMRHIRDACVTEKTASLAHDRAAAAK
jgi:hypothetical protein